MPQTLKCNPYQHCIFHSNASSNCFTERHTITETISQPYVIKAYNEKMGGVDMMDRLLESYHPATIMKKWWFSLFVNM